MATSTLLDERIHRTADSVSIALTAAARSKVDLFNDPSPENLEAADLKIRDYEEKLDRLHHLQNIDGMTAADDIEFVKTVKSLRRDLRNLAFKVSTAISEKDDAAKDALIYRFTEQASKINEILDAVRSKETHSKVMLEQSKMLEGVPHSPAPLAPLALPLPLEPPVAEPAAAQPRKKTIKIKRMAVPAVPTVPAAAAAAPLGRKTIKIKQSGVLTHEMSKLLKGRTFSLKPNKEKATIKTLKDALKEVELADDEYLDLLFIINDLVKKEGKLISFMAKTLTSALDEHKQEMTPDQVNEIKKVISSLTAKKSLAIRKIYNKYIV